MAKEFSLAYLTIPGVEPVEQIKIARDAGYDYVSLRTIPMGQPGEPQICLERDPELTENIRQTLKDTGMKLLDIELVRVREDLPADHRAAFEKGASWAPPRCWPASGPRTVPSRWTVWEPTVSRRPSSV